MSNSAIKKFKVAFSPKQLALLKLVSEYSDECKGSVLKFVQYAAIEKALEVLALLRKDQEEAANADTKGGDGAEPVSGAMGSDQVEEQKSVSTT